jgi:hypothetical protein
MATELTFDTILDKSPSDFGAPIVAKKEDGSFRSFGVNYNGIIVWSNNKDWYDAWIAGTVMPNSITLKEEPRLTKAKDEQGMDIKENGRQKYEPVPGEKSLVMVSLKTRTQLSNEEQNTIWLKLKDNRIRTAVLEEHNKYTAAAVAAADGAVITPERKLELDNIMAQYGL